MTFRLHFRVLDRFADFCRERHAQLIFVQRDRNDHRVVVISTGSDSYVIKKTTFIVIAHDFLHGFDRQYFWKYRVKTGTDANDEIRTDSITNRRKQVNREFHSFLK